MIRYQNQYGYSVNITPWFDLGYRLIDVELNNSLGGTLAGGVLNLVGSQSNLETQKLREEYYSGTFSILEEGMVIKEFNFFVVNRVFKREQLRLEFVCIPDSKYLRDFHNKTYRGNLREIIEEVFSGHEDFLSIEGDSSVQGIKTLYQYNESDLSFIGRVISGYHESGIFGYSWDKLIIKKTYDSDEIKEKSILIEALNEEQTPASKSYNNRLYNVPENLWENGKDNPKVGEDYSDFQPIFVRACSFMGDEIKYMGVDQYEMVMNSRKNISNLESDYFQKLNVTLKLFPKFQIGDVVEYYRHDIQTSEILWPYHYYLVFGTRMYFTTSGTGVTDPRAPKRGGDYNFTITLVGLEEDGKIALEKTNDEDPTIPEEERENPSYLKNAEGLTSSTGGNRMPILGEDFAEVKKLALQFGEEQGYFA